jgi:uncharacterized protein YdeI (YjbR/CyaY-like superfamily)
MELAGGVEMTASKTKRKAPTPRQRYPMPAFVRKALTEAGMMTAYRARPPYQQNDYVGWITRAKREDTRQRRLDQMLEELDKGDRYMKMAYRPKRSGHL